MNKKIFLVGGGKGGVGKSLVALCLVDQLLQRGEQCLLIESDTSNPDVYRCLKDEVESRALDLDDVDGWIELVNLCDKLPGQAIVVNTGARNDQAIKKFGALLTDSLSALHRELVTLWVVNTQRDSLELLKSYLEHMPSGLVHVVKNHFHGQDKAFSLYQDSNIRQQVEQSGGASLSFEQLASRVAMDIYNERMSIGRAMRELPLGNRIELSRWRSLVAKSFEVIHG